MSPERAVHQIPNGAEVGYRHETASARELLGDLAADRGDKAGAEEFYRRVLAEHPSLSGTSGCVELSLAELLLDANTAGSREEAVKLLQAWQERPLMKSDDQQFRWNLALIRAAEAMGDGETVRRAARTALLLADREPQLPQQRDVGLVTTDASTLQRLRDLAAQ
jgi:predicted Zn-dependent protease